MVYKLDDIFYETLPEILPKSLEWLYCSDSQLTTLPELPKGLKILHCSNNQLTSLPELPKSLKELYCYNNHLPSTDIKFYYMIQKIKSKRKKL